MGALNLKDILTKQLEITIEIDLPAQEQSFRLKEILDLAYEIGMATKHSTYDSVFFIIEDSLGFKVIKFYNDSSDYRSAYFESPGIAYSMAFHAL